jgi:hypothetical protein
MPLRSEYLTPPALAARWSGAISTGTLANWRSQGKGPAFQKIGGRVLYLETDVAAWEKENGIKK